MTRRLALGSLMACLLALGACSGNAAPPYAACGGSDDCTAEADACYRLSFTRADGSLADGRFCSAECASDASCPDDGVCLSLAADTSRRTICYAPCATSSDCFAGLRCTMVSGAGVAAVCMP